MTRPPSVVVSWASPGQAARPRVRIGQRVIPAEPRPYTDGLSGETVWTYHARVDGLRPGATYGYAVTADNDGNARRPVQRHVPHRAGGPGRVPVHQLRRPGHARTPHWVLSYGQSAYAVERGGVLPAAVPPAQRRPVLREPEPHGAAARYGGTSATTTRPRPRTGRGCRAWATTRWSSTTGRRASPPTCPATPCRTTGCPASAGAGTRSGSARCCSSRSTPTTWSTRTRPRSWPGPPRWPRRRAPATRRSSRARRSTSGATRGGAQTALAGARPWRPAARDESVDWIIVADAPVRLLLLGHRQRLRPRHPAGVAAAVRPVRGGPGALRPRPRLRAVLPGARRSTPAPGRESPPARPCNTLRPHPVTTADSGVFDTSQGTVHLILGCGGTDAHAGRVRRRRRAWAA